MKCGILLVLLAAICCLAQVPVPDAPEPKAIQTRLDKQAFFTPETDLELGASAVSIAFDGVSTMKVMAYQKNYGLREANPIARPFMNSRPLAGMYFATGFAVEVGADYFAYRKKWKWAKQLLPLIVAGAETSDVIHNYRYAHDASEVNNCLIHNPVVPAGMPMSPCFQIP